MSAIGAGTVQSVSAGQSKEDLPQVQTLSSIVTTSVPLTKWAEYSRTAGQRRLIYGSFDVKYAYIVEVQREGGDVWFTLAQCESPDIAAEIVRILLRAWGKTRSMIRISVTDAIA